MKYQHIRSCEYLDVPPEEAAEYDKYFRFPLSSKRGTGEDTEVKKSRRKWRKKLPKRRRHWLPSLRLWWLVNVGLPLLAVYLLSLLSSSWTGSGSDSGSGRESGSSSDSDYYFLGATRTRSVELLKRIDRLWMQWLIGHDTLFATVISSCSSCASLLQSVGIDRTVFHFAVVLGVISSVIFILRRFVTVRNLSAHMHIFRMMPLCHLHTSSFVNLPVHCWFTSSSCSGFTGSPST